MKIRSNGHRVKVTVVGIRKTIGYIPWREGALEMMQDVKERAKRLGVNDPFAPAPKQEGGAQ